MEIKEQIADLKVNLAVYKGREKDLLERSGVVKSITSLAADLKKTENQIVSLELSKKLKEAGFSNPGSFWNAPTDAEMSVALPGKITIGVIGGKSQTYYLYTTYNKIRFQFCFYLFLCYE